MNNLTEKIIIACGIFIIGIGHCEGKNSKKSRYSRPSDEREGAETYSGTYVALGRAKISKGDIK